MKTISVIGSGQMGAGISQVIAGQGGKVFLVDLQQAQLQKARKDIICSCDRFIKKGKMTEDQKEKILSQIIFTTQLEDIKKVDCVIEAVVENRNIKKDLFQKLSCMVSSQTLLCSNTSSISITDLASSIRFPERVLGLHFMNPVPLMPLVEGIRGLKTKTEYFLQARTFVESLGKTFIESKDTPGFVVNRILMPMINEAVYALSENLASIEDIDKAMKLGANFVMGPLELADFIGLDTCLSIMEVLHKGLGDDKYRPCPLLRQYVTAGWLGRKTQKGFYSYSSK